MHAPNEQCFDPSTQWITSIWRTTEPSGSIRTYYFSSNPPFVSLMFLVLFCWGSANGWKMQKCWICRIWAWTASEGKKSVDKSSKVEPKHTIRHNQIWNRIWIKLSRTHTRTTFEWCIFDKVVRAMGVICTVFFSFAVNWPIIGLYYLPIERYPIDFQVYSIKPTINSRRWSTEEKNRFQFSYSFRLVCMQEFPFAFFCLPRISHAHSHSRSQFLILDTAFFAFSVEFFFIFSVAVFCFCIFFSAGVL